MVSFSNQRSFTALIISQLSVTCIGVRPLKNHGSSAFIPITNEGSSTSFRLYSTEIESVPPVTAIVPSFHCNMPLPDSQYTQVLTTNSIMSTANNLRAFYEGHFQDPREPNGRRFIWDPWFVNVGDGKFGLIRSNESSITSTDEQIPLEGEVEAVNSQIQYSLKRIQASDFFPQELNEEMIDGLLSVAKSVGLTAITPPWISMYCNGDLQNLHTDAPQGPLAFVWSLSNDGDFEGGETMIMKPQILDLWRGFDTRKGLETGDIMRYIPSSPMGRCLAFDPRVPHGVNRVVGTQDPRRARIAIHGWFNEPEVCWFGDWDENEVSEANTLLEEAIEPLVGLLGSGEIGRVVGYLAVRLELDEDGLVDDVVAVADTLRADWDDYRGVVGYDEVDRPVMEDSCSDVKLTIFETMKNLAFEEGGNDRSIVVPFAFE